MKSEPITMQLNPDRFGPDLLPLSEVQGTARLSLAAISRLEVRARIEASPLTEHEYRRLRWVLSVMSRATATRPRPLTWWERITGRLKP